jgi:nucleotide-binding universal stress UspA family protein
VFSTIMTPVDLAHQEQLEKSLKCTADLARHYNAKVVFVGVTANTPSSVAHTPEEYADKLGKFAAGQGELHGYDAAAHAVTSHDPAADLEDKLLHAVSDTGADLVVMASHVPGLAEHFWPSNGGKIAAHAKASVLVVRDR